MSYLRNQVKNLDSIPPATKPAETVDQHKWPLNKEQIMHMTRDWNDLGTSMGRFAQIGGLQGLEHALYTDLKNGIRQSELESVVQDRPDRTVHQNRFSQRIEQYGENVITKAEMRTFWSFVVEVYMEDMMLHILTVAAVVEIVISQLPCGHGLVEGIAIMIAVALVVYVSALNDFQKEQQFREQQEQASVKETTVIRGSKEMRVNFEHVVVGDLVNLGVGATVPADGFFVFGPELGLVEATLNGESRTAKKNPMAPLILAGTQCAEGQGHYIVTAVGDNSVWGQVMAGLQSESEDTPLQVKLDYMALVIGYGGGAAAIIIFFAMLIRDAVNLAPGESLDHNKILGFFTIAVTIVVVAVPEGLPLAVTLSLAYSMKQMYLENNFVRVLAACETMGNCTTICSDKTGTLTKNEMTVCQLLVGSERYGNTNELPGHEDIKGCGDLIRKTILLPSTSFLKSDYFMSEKELAVGGKTGEQNRKKLVEALKEGPLFTNANQTEHGLCKWACIALFPGLPENMKNKDIGKDGSEQAWANRGTTRALALKVKEDFDQFKDVKNAGRQIKIWPFASKFKRASCLQVNPEEPSGDAYIMYVKGAAEQVLQMCDSYITPEGNTMKLGQGTDTDEILRTMESMASTGLRCLGTAVKNLGANDIAWTNDKRVDVLPDADQPAGFWENYTFVCMCGLKDPVRKEVPKAVADVQGAGVIVRMVTGDMLTTAKHIARECGIYTAKHHIAVTRTELNIQMDKLGDEHPDLAKWMYNLRVVARSQPDDKERLVRWFKKFGGPNGTGDTVAVTGDGANDALALKMADIGLSMGIQGTDVAKEASDVVILDDNFKSIVTTLKWGRCVFDNIRKFLQFQLTVNVVAVCYELIAAFVPGAELPLTAVQLLWINLIMDTLAALALGTERPTPELLERRPYGKDSSLISPVMKRFIGGHSIFQLTFLIWFLFPPGKDFLVSTMSLDQYENKNCKAIPTVRRRLGGDGCAQKTYGPAFYPQNAVAGYDPRICETNIWKAMIFNIFTWFQIFNMLNARKVNAEPNFLGGIGTSKLYMMVWVGICVMQVVLIEVMGRVSFEVSSTLPLNAEQWMMSLGFGACAVLWNFVLQAIPIDTRSQEIKLDEAHAFARDAMDGEVRAVYQEQTPVTEMQTMATRDRPGEMIRDDSGSFVPTKPSTMGRGDSVVTEG